MIKVVKLVIFFIILFVHLGYCFRLEKRYIIDDSNRQIGIKRYYRIISLYPAHTENIVALGGTNRLVGISISDTYPDFILDKPRFSYHFGIERFLKVRPDLILIRPMIDMGYKNLISQLEKNNIKIVSLQPKSLDDLYEYWKILGVLIGNLDRANNMIYDFKSMLSKFDNINKKIKHKKYVYFESIHRKVKTFCNTSIAASILSKAGGINVADDAICVKSTNIADYGKERLFSKADKIDVYLTQRGRMNKVDVAKIKHEPGFMIIKAVKNNQVYVVDEELTSRPTLRLLLGIYEIGHILYPEYYNNQLKKEVIQIIKKYYKED